MKVSRQECAELDNVQRLLEAVPFPSLASQWQAPGGASSDRPRTWLVVR